MSPQIFYHVTLKRNISYLYFTHFYRLPHNYRISQEIIVIIINILQLSKTVIYVIKPYNVSSAIVSSQGRGTEILVPVTPEIN